MPEEQHIPIGVHDVNADDVDPSPPWLEHNIVSTKQWSCQFQGVELALAVNLEIGNTFISAGQLDRALEYLGLSVERRAEFIRSVQIDLA